MQHSTTDRGFDHMEPVPSEYGGNVSVSESSNAGYAGVWLRAEETMSDAFPKQVALNLTASNAWLLGRQLLWLVVNHYQGDARPEEHFDEARAALDAALSTAERVQGGGEPTGEELLVALSRAGFALVHVAEAEVIA